MGLLDKVKKAIGGGTPPPAKQGGGQKTGAQGGNRQGGQGGGNRQGGGTRQGGQGGNRQGGQGGGNRQGGQGGGNRQGGDGNAEGSSTGNRRRGSRGGRNRSRQGSGQGGDEQGQGTQTQSGGRQGGGRQGQGGQGRQDGGEGTQERGDGQSSNARRRRRGGRGRGGSGGSSETGSAQQGSTRKVTRSDAAELKEKGEGGGGSSRSGNRSGGGRSRGGSGGGNRKRSGGQGGSGSGSGGGRRRERTRRGSASSGSHRRVLDANERPKDPVKKQILINASDPNEIRVAIREQQKVVEVYVERKGKRSLAGNIYKGRVQNVLRGMEAAFVDIGLERNGFLYVDEVTPAAADSDQIMKVSMVTEVEGVAAPNGTEGDTVPSTSDAAAAASSDGAAEVEATEVMEPGTPAEAMAIAAATNDETLDIDDAMEEEDREAAAAAAEGAADATGEGAAKADKPQGRGRARIQNKKKIQELLKNGQEILVQVVKDPMGTKGSRLTTQYSLAGRYLVYVPDGEGLGVSRRLEDAERNRLRDIVKQFELPWGGGLIVRTAAEGAREEDIAKDLDLLLRLHEQLMDKAGQARAPKLLYNEADLSLRIIRDLFNDEVEEVLVDDERHYQRIMNYLKRTSPQLAERVRMHDGQRPVFESYGVEDAIRSTLTKRAELVSGGYLIIDKTEAFHVIDVNTGRNVGTTASLEETITKTNMEAAEEVVRQLRLRDLGGIIVIDFIDMNLMKNRDMLLEHFRKELSKDRTKTYLVEISPLGLVEMTRQNVSEGVREILTSTCRACEGRGVQVSAETHAIDVERAVIELTGGLDETVEAIAIEAQPEVAKVLAGNPAKQTELDKRAGKHVRVMVDPDLTPNSFAVRAQGTTDEVVALPDPLLRGTKHKVLIEKVDPLSEDDGIAVVDGVVVTVIGGGASVGEEKTILIAASAGGRAFATLVKPARRRRRRGGRGRKRTTAAVGAVGSTDALDDDDDVDDVDGDEGDDDEFEDELDDELGEDVPEVDEEDDARTEIPQREVMLADDVEVEGGDGLRLDEDEDEDDEPDEDEDEDENDEPDEDEDDDEDEGDDASDSDAGSDGSDDGDDDPDDDPSGSFADEDEDDEGDDDEDEDGSLDLISTTDGDEADDAPSLVGRIAPGDDDRDEPSIDVEGSDDLLQSRGVAVPAAARPRTGAGQRTATTTSATASSDGTDGAGEVELGPDGQPRRRRRRGSRGGRNRNRGGANRSGNGGSGGSGAGSATGGGPVSGGSAAAPSSDG